MKKIYSLITLAITSLGFAQAELPFSYNGGKTGIPSGLTQYGLGTDYGTSPKFKFDNTNDSLVLHYNQSGSTLTFDIKHNPSNSTGWANTQNNFKVFESSNGILYTELYNFNQTNIIPLDEAVTKTINVNSNSRYIKWVYVNKSSGNVALGNINLTISSPADEITTPELTVSTESLTGFTYIEQNGPSTPQNFGISGENLDGTQVTITAPTGFLISTVEEPEEYEQFITLQAYTGTPQTFFVILASELVAGSYSGNIIISGGGITTPINIAVSGIVTEQILTPEIEVDTTEIANLNYAFGEGPSTTASFSMSGENLDGTNVVLTVTESFEISTDNNTFYNTLTLPAYSSNEETSIYVRLKADLSINTYEGTITINGGGITTPLVITLSGEVSQNASTIENNIEGLKIYPNPASNLVNIISNEIGTKNISIYNMLGKKVLETSTEETVNVSTLTSGVYIMKISQDGKNASRKLVIK